MGIEVRLATIFKNPSFTQEQKDNILKSVERLVEYENMGEIYKVLSIVNSKISSEPPGFKELEI